VAASVTGGAGEADESVLGASVVGFGVDGGGPAPG
jgi:hypothetical protein